MIQNVINFFVNNQALIVAILIGIVSEGLSVVQQLKYPTNSGVGGVLSSILKVLQFFNKAPSA